MKKRLFIAIQPSRETIAKITSFNSKLKADLPYRGIRWVKSELMHLTLVFLGETDVSLLPRLSESIRKAALVQPPYELHYHGTGWFGRKSSVRTLWVGCSDDGSTERLFRGLQKELAVLSIKADQKFSPHLTMASISDTVTVPEREAICSRLEECKAVDFGTDHVGKFVLVESQLAPDGPVYKTIEQFILG